MKKNLLKSLLAVALLLVCGNVWGETVTFTFSDLATANSWENGVAYTPVTISPITLSADGGGNNAKYYTSDQTWRMYNGGTVTITPEEGYEITAVSSNPSRTFTITDGSASLSFTETVKFKSITVSYKVAGTAVHFDHAGTESDPYSVADAYTAVDNNTGINGVYAKGVVSKIVTAFNSQYNNITFDISDDGSENGNQLRAYRCKKSSVEGAPDVADIQVGDIVVVYGDLTLYNSTYEFSADNVLISRESTSTKIAAGLSFSASSVEADLANLSSFVAPTLTNPYNLPVAYTSSNTEVATVDENGTVSIVGEGNAVITVTSKETDNYLAGEAHYTITVTNTGVVLVTVDENGNTTFDLSNNAWHFPTSKQVDEGSYTMNGYTIKVAGSEGNGFNYYANGKALLFGKTGAYLTLPPFDYNVGKIDVVGASGASDKVKQNIFVGDSVVSTETTGASDVTNTYNIAEDYQAEGTIYTLKVTNAYNTQVTKIIVYKAVVDERDDAEIAFSPETLTIYKENTEYTKPQFVNPNEISLSEIEFTTTSSEVAKWSDDGLVLGGETGTATITATFAGNNEYKPATVTLKITVNAGKGYADLPFAFDDGMADIEGVDGFTQNGLGSDYSSSPKLKFDSTGDYLILHFNESPGKLTYDIKGNTFSGGTFKVQTSADGVNYSDLKTYSTFTGSIQSEVFNNLGDAVRYIKWIYTEKVSGNVALGNISLAKYAAPVNYTLSIGDPEFVTITANYGEEVLQNGDEAEVEAGAEITLALSINEGYDLESLTVVGDEGQTVTLTQEETVWTFNMPEFDVTVNASVVEHVEPVLAYYTLATAITPGKRYVFASGKVDDVYDLVVMAEQGTNNRRGKIARVVDGKLEVPEGLDFVIEGNATDGYTIYDDSEESRGYLYAASSDKNYLKTQEENDVNGLWTITFDATDGHASIVATQSENRNVMRYNPNNDSPLFSCYATASQSPVYLFQLVEETPSFETGDVNEDHEVNVSDVTMLVSMILGNTPVTDAADVNEDHEVNVSDVTALVSIILGQ